jgi:hypothetical protein
MNQNDVEFIKKIINSAKAHGKNKTDMVEISQVSYIQAIKDHYKFKTKESVRRYLEFFDIQGYIRIRGSGFIVSEKAKQEFWGDVNAETKSD